MVGIVVVSHSRKIAEGVCEIVNEIAHESCKIISAGGLADGSMGTDALKIADAIVKVDSGDGVVILVDIGSSVMSSEAAIEILKDEGHDVNAVIADAPLVEGSICAAVEASNGGSLEQVLKYAEESKDSSKL